MKKQAKKITEKLFENNFLVSTKIACDFFGISRETLSTWVDKGAPKEARGKFDLKKLHEWRYKGENMETPATRKLKAEADFKEAKAKQEKINIALFSLSEKIIEGKSLIDKILSESIIRKTSAFNDYAVIKNGRRQYYSYAAAIEYCVYVFELRRLETYIKEHNEEYKENCIMYSSALYPEDGSRIEDLTAKLNSFHPVQKDEE